MVDRLQQRRQDAHRAANPESQHDKPNVLHAGISQQALDIPLHVHKQRRGGHRKPAEDQKNILSELRINPLVQDDRKANHDQQRAIQQHPGEQRTDRTGGFAMGVWQPGVHWKDAGLCPKSDQHKDKCQFQQRGVQGLSVLNDARPQHRFFGDLHEVHRVRIHQDRAIQAKCHAHRTDDHILPGRFER